MTIILLLIIIGLLGAWPFVLVLVGLWALWNILWAVIDWLTD